MSALGETQVVEIDKDVDCCDHVDKVNLCFSSCWCGIVQSVKVFDRLSSWNLVAGESGEML